MALEDEDEKMPFVYRITAPLAKRKIKKLGFDRRKRESKIYEFAIQRYYMDILEILIAALVIVARLYLAFDLDLPFSGSMPLVGSDSLLFIISISTILKNWTLLGDYRKNVVTRIETTSRK